MEEYKVVGWIDHIEDEATGEVIFQGTPLNKKTLGHMDDGIKKATEELIKLSQKIFNVESELKVLKDSTLNNMTNNIFLERFENFSGIKIYKGIYDSFSRKIYI